MECKENEQGALEGLDIPALLESGDHGTIDMLKTDIEGSEEVLFGRIYERWIDNVKTIVIELHSDYHRELFLQALLGRNFEVSTTGELTIARRYHL